MFLVVGHRSMGMAVLLWSLASLSLGEGLDGLIWGCVVRVREGVDTGAGRAF